MLLTYQFIGKTKLPRGFSFPIGRSMLDGFLERERFTTITGVGFIGCSSPSDGRLLHADYRGWGNKYAEHSLNISISAVPSLMRLTAQRLLREAGFPVLSEWLRSFEDQTTLRSRTDHSLLLQLSPSPAAISSRQQIEETDFHLGIQRNS
jgi:hypothetical protein